jgi:hypothetical protein
MAELGVKCPATVIRVVPTHRVEAAILTPRITAFINRYQYMYILPLGRFKVIPLVKPAPYTGQMAGGNKSAVNNVECGLLLFGVAFKICANQFIVPWPIVFGVCRGMNANITPAPVYVMFKSGLLLVVQNVAGGAQKNDGRILTKIFFSEI